MTRLCERADFPELIQATAGQLGISRKTIESHAEHIKLKLGYANAEELKRGARDLLGTVVGSPQREKVGAVH